MTPPVRPGDRWRTTWLCWSQPAAASLSVTRDDDSGTRAHGLRHRRRQRHPCVLRTLRRVDWSPWPWGAGADPCLWPVRPGELHELLEPGHRAVPCLFAVGPRLAADRAAPAAGPISPGRDRDSAVARSPLPADPQAQATPGHRGTVESDPGPTVRHQAGPLRARGRRLRRADRCGPGPHRGRCGRGEPRGRNAGHRPDAVERPGSIRTGVGGLDDCLARAGAGGRRIR